VFWILLSTGKRYWSGTGFDAASAGSQDMPIKHFTGHSITV